MPTLHIPSAAVTSASLLYGLVGVYLALASFALAYWLMGRLGFRSRSYHRPSSVMTLRQASESASIHRMEMELRDVVRSITNVRSELVCWRDATGQTAQELQRVSSELESISERLSAIETRTKQLELPDSTSAQATASQPKVFTLYQAESAADRKTTPVVSQPSEKQSVKSNMVKDAKCGWVYTTAPAQRDDLTEIWGIGPGYERRLQQSGIYTFAQIASWSDETIDYFENLFSFKGRIRREKWVEQADRMKLQKSA